jgi:hypothetical protein
LFLGVAAMDELGVGMVARGSNIAAAALGLLLCASSRYLPDLPPSAMPLLAAAGIGTLLLTFASAGILGVHRWVPVGGFRLHAAAIVTPILIVCIAVLARRQSVASTAVAVVSTTVVALQPDAAQATSLAVATAIILTRELRGRRAHVMTGLALLAGASVLAFVKDDPLPPVRHVEGIFGAVASMGAAWAIGGAVSLLLLPVPFFALWAYSRNSVPLALCAYVALTVLAPAWGTFPVPVMGYGVSPILGYFLALAFCYKATARETTP